MDGASVRLEFRSFIPSIFPCLSLPPDHSAAWKTQLGSRLVFVLGDQATVV